MGEHEVSWESWQAVCKERDALKESLAEWKLDFRSVQADRDRYREALEWILKIALEHSEASIYATAKDALTNAESLGETK